MDLENMSVEEIERYQQDLMTEYFTIDVRKSEIIQLVTDAEVKKQEKLNPEAVAAPVQEEVAPAEEKAEVTPIVPAVEEVSAQEEVAPAEEKAEVTPIVPAVEETPVQEAVAPAEEKVEAAPVIPVVEEKAEVTPIAPAVEETPIQEAVAPTEEKVEAAPVIPVVEEKAEVTPIAPAVEETVSEIAPQQLDQTPLTPVGVEEEKNDVQYVKTDLNASKAILVSETQGTKLRKTAEQQKNMVFNSIEEKTETIPAEEKPAEAIDSIVDSAQVAPLESKEDIDKQLQAMLEQLRVTTDEDKAAELNSRISELSEKAKILQKAA